MSVDALEIIESRFSEERPSEPRELFCKDFDFGCFEVKNAALCKQGTSVTIADVRFYTLPVKAMCPLCERLL